jgi:hypothetical protein
VILRAVIRAAALGFALLMLLAGCAGKRPSEALRDFTVTDFRLAAENGRSARKDGKLPKNDRWPECFEQIADRLEEVGQAGDENSTTGVAQIAMKVHILRSKPDDGISAECAQVVLRLEKDGIKLALKLFPGGDLAGGTLGRLTGR